MAKKITILVLVSCLSMGAVTAVAETTRSLNVTGLYRIDVDFEVLGGDVGETVITLVENPAVMNQAAKTVYRQNLEDGLRLDRHRVSGSRIRGRLLHSMELRFSGLPDEGMSKAQQFLRAVGENLNQALRQIYNDNQSQLSLELDQARERMMNAKARIVATTAADPMQQAVQEQLEQVVDMSAWRPEMVLGEAFEILREAVDRTLNLAVLWNDLSSSCGLDPEDPIELDGFSDTRLRTTLEILLQAVSDNTTPIGYIILDGVVVVATESTLMRMAPPPGFLDGQESIDDLRERLYFVPFVWATARTRERDTLKGAVH
ncbi:hypothetical protein ACFL6U_32430 [Planctomycetota bacterium]